MRAAQLRVLGGAMARVPEDATAFAHRTSRIMVNIAALLGRTTEDRRRRAAWVDEFSRDLEQGDDGAYVNFVADEGESAVHAAYPGATWDRLVAVKAATTRRTCSIATRTSRRPVGESPRPEVQVALPIRAARPQFRRGSWLARKDSNLRSPDPESGALPLGHSPVERRR